jgi:hypothetical protein
VSKLTRVVQGTKQETLYNIDMYWVGCAEEDIITLVSDGLHHNLGKRRPLRSRLSLILIDTPHTHNRSRKPRHSAK